MYGNMNNTKNFLAKTISSELCLNKEGMKTLT